MDFIKLFDWSLKNYIDDDEQFLDVTDIKTSATNKILNGIYKDPLLKCSSDSDSENDLEAKNLINMLKSVNPSSINTKRNNKNLLKPYIPGFRPLPLYPKGSSLTKSQHHACLLIKAVQDPAIQIITLQAPDQDDYKLLEELQPKIAKEQEEFCAWAKTIWSEGQCARVLRPKPLFTKLADADFQMRQSESISLPQDYQMVAQISLSNDKDVDLVFVGDIGKECPRPPEIVLPNLKKRVDLLTSTIKLPTVCPQHPYHINLPGESVKNVKSRTEVTRNLVELAQKENVQFIVSGSALQALADLSKSWHLAVTVKQEAGLGVQNVIIVDGPIAVTKPTSKQLTARAIALLLQHELAGNVSKSTDKSVDDEKSHTAISHRNVNTEIIGDKFGEHSDSEDDQLAIIDANESIASKDDSNKEIIKGTNTLEQATGILTRQMRRAASRKSTNELDISSSPNTAAKSPTPKTVQPKAKSLRSVSTRSSNSISASTPSCHCGGVPKLRQYKKWELRTKEESQAVIPVIVHTSRKFVKEDNEVIINPIIEYQVEIGACAMSENEMQALILALHLRGNSLALTARVDASSGELITLEWTNEEKLLSCFSQSLLAPSLSIAHATLQLLGKLNPGSYVLRHEPKHGPNAMLYVASRSPPTHPAQDWLFLQAKTIDNSKEELEDAKVPPELCNAILPIHRHRKQLPLMFLANYKPKKQHLKKQAEKEKKEEAAKKKRQFLLTKKERQQLKRKKRQNVFKKK